MRKWNFHRMIMSLFFTILWISCENLEDLNDLGSIDYDPTPFIVNNPDGFPQMEIPEDNPMTVEGVDLGRMLFNDPILSADSSISCESCHQQSLAFSDDKAFSDGINKLKTTRSSMPLFNVGYYYNGMFWDGRVNTLEEQSLHPVENPVEMGEDWGKVEQKLQRHSLYPQLFRKAFGIKDRNEITKELTAKAISQFERTLISANSRYDRVFLREEGLPTDSELRGFRMFFFETSGGGVGLVDAECGHCHNGPLLSSNQYFNNGLDEALSLDDFEDIGRGEVTGLKSDNGKFRAPTLRNIIFNAPYMHDGRFHTIEEVIEHYNSGGHYAENLDVNIRPLQLTDQQKEDIKAFLLMLTDSSLLQTAF